MKKPGLDGRRRDVSGEISRKHGNTRIGALRKVYGPAFAKGIQGEATVAEVLRAVGIEAISQEDRTLLLKGTIHSFKGRRGKSLEVTSQEPVYSKVKMKAEGGGEAHRRIPLKAQVIGWKGRLEGGRARKRRAPGRKQRFWTRSPTGQAIGRKRNTGIEMCRFLHSGIGLPIRFMRTAWTRSSDAT
jgi:hypothetical protein